MVLLCCVNVQLKADELTVANGSATNSYVPIYGLYADTQGTHGQCLYPADSLSDLAGGSISQLTIYLSSPTSKTWPGVGITVSLGETEATQLTTSFITDDLTAVATTAWDPTQTTIVIAFDQPYTYAGGNLVVDFKVTTAASDYVTATFLGVGNLTASGHYSYSSSNSVTAFLPKATFTYTPGAAPSCDKPETLDVTGVTASSAAFTWAGGSGTYNLEYKKASADKWTVVLESTTATTHTLTGLEANTAYQARVNCVCGEEASGYKTISFQTPIALPYVQPFSTSSTPDGWSQATGILNSDGSATLSSTTSAWTFGTGSSYGSIFGSSHAYGSCYSFYYSSSSYYKWLISPSIPLEEGLQLSFDLALTNSSGNAVTKGSQSGFEFVVLASVDGGTNWLEIRRWNNSGSTYVFDDISSTGEEIELDLSAYTSGSAQFAFYLVSSSTASTSYAYIHIDNVRIGAIPTCRKPTGLKEVAGKATKNSIQVTWSPVTSETEWKVQYKKASDSEWSVLTATDTIATISGLLAFTDYNVRVAAVCGEEMTDYGNQITVKTAAGVPFEQSFAKSSLPSEWKRYTGLWEAIQNSGELESTTSGWSTVYKTNSNANGVFPDSTYHLYLNIAGTDCKNWLVSPTIEMEAGYQLTFNMSLTPKSATSPKAVTAGAQIDDQFILAIYDAENGWTPLRTWDNSSSAFDNIKGTANGEVVKVSLDDYAGKAIQIAFYGESQTANGDNNLHIQNVKIATVPACENTTSLDVAAIGGTTATLVWDAVGGATWQYFHMVKPEGEFTPTDDKFTNSTDGYSVELTGLDENTDYVFYFRRKCGDTEYSDILMREFKTSQTPASIPFSDNFEGSNCGWLLINGDQTNAWVCGSATNNGGAKSLYISDDNGDTHEYNVGSASVVYATKTFTFDEAGVYSFSYDWKANGESSCDYMRVALAPQNANVVAGTLYNGLDASSTPSNWIALDGGGKLNLKTEWQHVSLEYNIEEAGRYKVVILWRNDGSMGTQTPAAIDNFSISRVLCNAPSGLAISDLGAESATFVWNDDNDGNTWAYAFALADEDEPAVFTDVDNNSVTITTGLTECTSYKFYLRKHCGETYSESVVLPFQTSQLPVVVGNGFTDGFEGANNWQFVNGDKINKWVIGTAAHKDGEKALYISNDEGVTNAYTNGNAALVYASKMFTFADDTYTFSYDWQANGESSYDLLFVGLVPANTVLEVDAPAGQFSWPTGWTALHSATKLNLSTTWQTETIEKTLTAGDYKVVFAWRNDGSGGSQTPAAVDNFSISRVLCVTPSNLKVVPDSIKTDSAFIKWDALNADANYLVRYRKIGADEWINLDAIEADSVWLTGLDHSSSYEVQVAGWCDPTDPETKSDFSASIQFTTECEAITSFPWSENFDDLTSGANINLPCWGNEHISGSGTYLFQVAAGSSASATTNVGKLPDMSSGTITELSLPEMAIPTANAYEFYISVYRNATGTSSPEEGLRILVAQGTDTTELGFIARNITTAPVESATGWYRYNFTIPVAGNVNIIVRGESKYGSATYFDDLLIREIPSCLEPEGLTVDTIGADMAVLKWNNVVSGAWKYACVLASAAEPADGAFVAVTDTFVQVNGLTDNTQYVFYLRHDCGSNGHSPSISVPFQTLQLPATVPYANNFESGCDWQFINGTLTNAWAYGEAAHNGEGTHALYISNDGGATHAYTNNSVAVVYAARLFNFETGNYQFSYDWIANGESSSDYLRVMLVPASVNLTAGTSLPSGVTATGLPSGWIALDGGSKLNGVTAWQSFTSAIIPMTAGLYNVVLLWKNDGSVGNMPPAAVDNFSVSKLSCVPPTNLAAELTQGNGSIATLSWTVGESETAWVLEYSVNADMSDSISLEVNTLSKDLTGLTAETTYYARVKSVCGEEEASDWSSVISFTPTNAVELTINNGTQTSALVPISSNYLYSYYYEEGSKSQFIIPADSLTNVQWGKIKQLTFFSSSATFSFGNATFEAYMETAPATTFASDAFVNWTSLTKVMNAASLAVEGNKMVVTLDEPYDYTGGDLLIGIKSVASAYISSSCYWQGITATNAAVASEYDYDYYYEEYYEEPERKNFLPKLGIAYIPGEEPSCLKPTGLTVTYNGGDSAVVNWTSDAASWNLDVNGEVKAVTAKPYTIHGLSLATAYAVKVQAVCGPENLSEWTAAQNFATDVCMAEDQQSISYTLSDSYGDGWNGGATLKVVHKATSKEIAALTLSSGSSKNGTLALCCGEEYSFVWVSGSFDSECSFVIKDMDDAIILSQSNPTAGSLGDYTMVCPSCIKPSAVVIPDSTITATTAVVHWTAGHSSQTTWQLAYDTLQTNQPDTLPTFKAAVTETHDMLTGLLPEHTYFVYVRAYCGPADSSKWANVKSFTTASLCQKPSGLALESATTSALTISWNTYGQTGFNLRYGIDGTNWTVVNGIETSPYTIEGLAASTSYKVQLQAACAAAEANSWTTSLTAKTAYGIPFEEKFNATTIPTDWNQYSGMLVDGTIDQSKSSTYSWLFGTNNGVFDSHARLNICGASTNKLLVTPTIQVSGNTQLTFDIALSYWSGTLTPATAGQQADDKFVVLVSTDEGATWTVLRQWDNAGSEYVYDNIPCTAEGEPVTINLSAYSGQGVKLAFYGESTIAGGDNYLHVDNVLVDLIPTCLKPTKFNVSNVKAHTAKLAWTAGEEGQTAWQIAIDSVDFKPDTLSAADLAEILIDVTDTPYVVSGLKPEHTYYVYVRANCGSEDGVSRWSDKKSFTTTVACPAPTGLQAYLTPGNGAVAGLKWNGEAESWTVQYGTNNTFADGTYVELGDLQNDTIGLTDLTAEATYYARVKANCGSEDGESEWSSIVSFVPTSKYQLLINDGTATNEYVPVYGYYVDNLTRSQFIIPAETLEPLQWDTIKHLTFYTSSPANVNYGAATFEVFVAEVGQKTFASTTLYDWAEMDTVMAAGSLSVSGNKMEVEFTKPYQYQDGNLLIGIKQGVKGNDTHTYWYGVTATGASLSGYQGTSGLTISQRNFLPKMMIEFVPGVEPLCKDPKHLKLDEVTAHTATFSWDAQLGANWQYAVAPAGEQPDEFEATTANSVEVINLNELTDYVFYLRRNCGEDGFSNIISLAFTTEAHITTVPFDDDFEGANYWQLNNGSLENAWVIGSAVANAGNRSLYISNDGGQNNTYNGDAQAAVFATLLIHLVKDSIYVFQYDWKCEGEYYEEDGALDYMRVAIVPATVETAAGLTPPDGFAGDALPAGWIALDGGQALVEADAWQHVSVDTALTAGDYKVVIAWVNDEADAGETAAAIDNFSIRYKQGQATGFNDGLIGSDKAVKFIRNNHVYILVNGRIYDATGRKVE